MSGQRRGIMASTMRCALQACSLPYGIGVSIRNHRFDRQPEQARQVGVPVISVGNLTTGGTGKTPIVCYLANWFHRQGIRVAIVSRGYGGREGDRNDEALELHARLPDVPHVQNPDRVAAAHAAIEDSAAELILMDDGFQHRRLIRDLDIVVVDATCPFGFGHLLPRGLLREPISGIARADLVILTRVDAVSADFIRSIEQVIRRHGGTIPIVHSTHTPTFLLTYPDQTEPIVPVRVAALSAIGNPEAFLKSLNRSGLRVVASQQLPDHDAYASATVDEIKRWVNSLGDQIDLVVCTHKDLVKLQTDRLGGKPLKALMIDLQLRGNERELELQLEQFADRIQAARKSAV